MEHLSTQPYLLVEGFPGVIKSLALQKSPVVLSRVLESLTQTGRGTVGVGSQLGKCVGIVHGSVRNSAWAEGLWRRTAKSSAPRSHHWLVLCECISAILIICSIYLIIPPFAAPSP